MANLKENYLKKFFLENDLVLSSYFSFAWTTNGIGNFDRIIKIKQKLDKKVFVWFKKIEKKEIIFKNIFYYDEKNNSFEEKNFFSVIKKEKEIKNFFKDEFKKLDFWLEINIFSLVPRGYTLWFSWTIWSLTISWIEIFRKNLWQDFFEKNILEEKKHFESIRKKSFLFEYLVKNKNTAWEASFMTFINDSNPIFYNIWEEKKEYKAYKLLDLENFPVNFLVIFSGLKVNSDRIEKNNEVNKQKIEEIQDFLVKDFEFPKKSYTKKFLETKKIYSNLNDILVSLNSFSLYFIKKIIDFEQKHDIYDFFENINKIRSSLEIFEKQIDFATKFYNYFLDLKKYFHSNIWITSWTSSVAGWTYIIFYEEKEEDSIKKTIWKIKKFYPNLEFLYDSNKKLNNNEKYWIKIEQFISKKILGKYSNKKWVLLKTKNSIKIIENKNFEELDFDILIDSIKNKIYIAKQKLNSSQIHSQSVACEILIKLLNSENNKISNEKLNFWAYKDSKIELNWKVIYPLKKIIKQKLNYNFDIKITWTISHYEIILNKKNIENLNIWIIEKI